MDEDSDDDDLFADFEKDDDLEDANVSANLVGDVGEEHCAKRVESLDDGKRIGWVAPSASGLKNSTTLNAKAVNHWYFEIKNKPDTNKPSPGGGPAAPLMSGGGTGLWHAPEEMMRTKPREEMRQQLAANRAFAQSTNGTFTHAHMKNGIDEEGNRVRIFSSALTSERCIKCGLGKFMYKGDIMETSKDQLRMHVNNLQPTDARHGYGECMYDSGSSYVGEWQHDRRWGTGKFIFACGDVYEGEWHDGQYSGNGRYTSHSGGDAYEGKWKNDLCDGYGTYEYNETGERYVGEFEAGLRCGMGTYTFADGNSFVGTYRQGERHGRGTFWFASGEADVGAYEEGRDSGEGARWDASRTSAWLLRDGQPVEPISLDEAARIAAALGLPVPSAGGASAAGPAGAGAVTASMSAMSMMPPPPVPATPSAFAAFMPPPPVEPPMFKPAMAPMMPPAAPALAAGDFAPRPDLFASAFTFGSDGSIKW